MLALAAVECKWSGQEALAQEPALGRHPGQHVEEPAAHRQDVLLERLTVQALLHREEAVVQAGLERAEEQALVQATRTVEAAGVAEAPAQGELRAAPQASRASIDNWSGTYRPTEKCPSPGRT